MPPCLHHSVLKTLSFFDLFDYPLTSYEVWKWLHSDRTATFNETLIALVELCHLGLVRFQKGFYTLPHREAMIPKRLSRFRDAEKKWRRALSAARWLGRFPFIRFVGIGNTLAYSNAAKEGDIDFFIITKPERIWTARFISALFFELLRLRPRPLRLENSICLSFWVTSDHLDLSDVAIHEHDIYLQYWIAQLYPLFNSEGKTRKGFSPSEPSPFQGASKRGMNPRLSADDHPAPRAQGINELNVDKIYEQWWNANRESLKFLPHVQPARTHPLRRMMLGKTESLFKTFVEWFLSDRIGNGIESRLKKFQLRRLPPVLRNEMNLGKGVMINDEILKFHDHDRREHLYEQWTQRIQSCSKAYEYTQREKLATAR